MGHRPAVGPQAGRCGSDPFGLHLSQMPGLDLMVPEAPPGCRCGL